MRFIASIITFLLLLIALGGCGGRKVVATKPVDMTIPAELAKAFEVKEMPQAAVKPVSAPTEQPEQPKKSRKKERKKQPKKAQKKEQAKQGEPGPAEFTIPNRRPEKDPIWVGEKVWMDVTWLNTKAGEFEIETLPHKEVNGRKVYDFKGTARTSELFSLVYRAEDWVESFVDYEGWFPYKFVLHGDETKHIRNNLELFDHPAKKQYVAVHDNRIQKGEIFEEKGYKDLTPLSQDSLSAIFYVRTLPFEVGKTIHFPMTTNGNQFETEVTVLGREEVQTKMGYLKAFKTKVETRFKGVLQQQGDAFMWFSDDDRKFILRFEAKVRIGWVAGVTKKIEPGVSPETISPPPVEVKPATDKSVQEKSTTSVDENDGLPKGAKRRKWFHELIESVSAVKKK